MRCETKLCVVAENISGCSVSHVPEGHHGMQGHFKRSLVATTVSACFSIVVPGQCALKARSGPGRDQSSGPGGGGFIGRERVHGGLVQS